MSRPFVSGNETSNPNPPAEGKLRPWPGSFEDDLADLTARFAAMGGSPELSSDLAFQVVLNEIVEQACLATGATGAAIALERYGELQCRACTGTTAPQIGTPVDAGQGLSGECVRTRQVQVCSDTEVDLRVDADVSQQLGIRSVIVLPLLLGDNLVGVLEAFATRPGAFGERDQRTLEALALRVLKNMELAASLGPVQSTTAPSASGPESNEIQGHEYPAVDRRAVDLQGMELPTSALEGEIRRNRWIRPLSSTLAALTVVIAIGLWARLSQRLGWIKVETRAHAASTLHPAAPNPAANQAPDSPAEQPSPNPPTTLTAGNSRAKGSAANRPIPEGGLLVYENGKEVFRMLPDEPSAGGQTRPARTRPSDSAGESAMRPASAIEPDVNIPVPAGFTRVPQSIAEANLAQRLEPDYPYIARQQNIQGVVVLDVRAGTDGAVEHISLISGPPVLADAAIRAVSHWRFKPELTNGQGSGIVTRITLNFRLPR
jgi:TonB family protein